MSRTGLIILISLLFCRPVTAQNSCDVPACDLPPVFQDLRDSNQLIDDSPNLIRGAVEGLSSLFQPGDEHCPTDYQEPEPSDDGIERVSDIFSQGPSSDVGSISRISVSEAQALFNSLRDDCRIPHQMNIDGCYARAHAMAKIAGDRGVSVAKAFFSPYSRGGLSMSNPITGEYVEQRSQAAIAVAVQGPDGSSQPYIIDPSVATGPMPLNQYRQLLSTYESAEAVNVQFASRYRYGRSERYQEHGYHEDQMIGWGQGDAYEAEYNLNDFRRIQHHFQSDNPDRCSCVGGVLNEFWSMIPAETSSVVQAQCMTMAPASR
ncbi:MAG: hypothetical protein HRT45_08090 [Bdellovibrionales bacterium]|nr:hypothetical protein [Bdellovibrionales bacterium]